MENGTDQANEYIEVPSATWPRLSDEHVWLTIYTAVANRHNSNGEAALIWADSGLRDFRARFRR